GRRGGYKASFAHDTDAAYCYGGHNDTGIFNILRIEFLSTEYYTYSKEEITRQEKHKPERKEDAKNKPAKKKGRGRKPGENLADEEIAFLSEEELAERLSESEDEPQDR
ncbi:MAG: hypothetical protein II974_08590, partial [Firmicutes bacterium]|nr:hypothetical protein [Bacillota bacterium]